MSFHSLSVREFSAGYPGRPVIAGLTLDPLRGGGLTALVGPNAAGKTTLLRGLAGLVRANGSVRLDGRELLGLGAAEHAIHVGYMPQALPQRVALTVFEAVLSALRSSPAGGNAADARLRAMATLRRLGIADIALRGLDELSGGQRQLASLAQALAREPAVLLLDEPTSALDLNHQYRVMSIVSEIARETGMVAVLVLHDIALACRWCDRVVVLSQGRIAADGRPEIAVTPQVLAQVYGIFARVERCSQGYLQISVDGIAGTEADERKAG